MKSILIIDDDIDFLEFLSLCFIDGDYHVISTVSPDKIPLNDHQLPDLFIIDYSLPVENGASVTKKLKRSPKTAHIPILMISADGSLENVTKQAGADAFLAKPLEVDTLLETVSTLTT